MLPISAWIRLEWISDFNWLQNLKGISVRVNLTGDKCARANGSRGSKKLASGQLPQRTVLLFPSADSERAHGLCGQLCPALSGLGRAYMAYPAINDEPRTG